MKTKRATTRTPPSVLRILATTDFSATSRSGVRYAIALAEKLGSTVALLHVIELPSWLSELGSMVPARKESELVALARAKLATLAKREGKGDLAISWSVRTGKPFHEIIAAAREHRADLIVIATHGYTGFEHVLLGSTAKRVVRHAPCPVLTVSPRIKPRLYGKRRSGRTSGDGHRRAQG